MNYFKSAYIKGQRKLTNFNFPDHYAINRNIGDEIMAANKPLINNNSEAKNKRFAKYQCGQVSLTIWENKKEDNESSFLSFNIKKSYLDANSEWKVTESLNINDLQNIQALCQKAVSELRIKVSL